ncbi:MAG: polysaccharide deacetylase family protein [Candidatus Margulisiibacteriota bacterium]
MSILSKNNCCTVLMYHRIRPRLSGGKRYPNTGLAVYLDEFEKQMAFLKKNCNVLSKNEFIECVKNGFVFPKRSVLLTFDDGSTDIYEHAYPILKKHDIPAIVFIPTDFIGSNKVFWWEELELYLMDSPEAYIKEALYMVELSDEEKVKYLKEVKAKYKVKGQNIGRSALTWEEIREMIGSGISFQPHTKTHIRLTNISDNEAEIEILGSKKAVEDNLGSKADVFSYPHGGISDFTNVHEDILKRNGFKLAFSTFEWEVRKGCDIYALPRLAVTSLDGFIMYRIKISEMPVLFKKILRKIHDKCVKP